MRTNLITNLHYNINFALYLLHLLFILFYASEENHVNALNWGDYTKRHLKSPLNPKLVPK